MGNWIYNGSEVTPDQVDEEHKDSVGFIYIITNTKNNKKYIGQKKLWKVVTKPPLKGQKRKRKITSQSDWMTYHGSSEALKGDVEKLGADAFHREIIVFCKGKAEMNYRETKLQMDRDVLFKPDEYYNGIINIRLSRSQMPNKPVDI